MIFIHLRQVLNLLTLSVSLSLPHYSYPNNQIPNFPLLLAIMIITAFLLILHAELTLTVPTIWTNLFLRQHIFITLSYNSFSTFISLNYCIPFILPYLFLSHLLIISIHLYKSVIVWSIQFNLLLWNMELWNPVYYKMMPVSL